MSNPTLLKIPDWLRAIARDPFRGTLFLGLILLGVGLSLHQHRHQPRIALPEPQIAFFFHPQCPHCRRQEAFLPSLQARYPEISWARYDTSVPENRSLLITYLRKNGLSTTEIGVPMTFVGPYVIDGFDSAETTGVRLEQAIRALLENDPSLFPETGNSDGGKRTLTLPLLGTLRPAEHSLPVLAMIIGLVDGFNPCAMWVLVYLISMIVNLGDRRKIWLLVGTFVLSSGILYFLFMTAWLNAFLLLGYLRPLTLAIGLAALGIGILNVREYIQTKGQPTCTLGDAASKQKTRGRIDHLVNTPLNLASVLGIITLAFLVNSIEFACSAALPAIFTHTLALRNLPVFEYYSYILLYDVFFMLDDLIIFSLAVLALDTSIGQRYAGHCRIIGGIVLIGLGTVMVFRPEWLR